MKPHIFYSLGKWWCICLDFHIAGASPLEAYTAWLGARTGPGALLLAAQQDYGDDVEEAL